MNIVERLIEIFDRRVENIRRAKTLHLRYGFSVNDREFNLSYAVVIIYACWEGFVKEVMTEYLQYINSLNLAINKLDEHYYSRVVDQYIEFKNNIHDRNIIRKKCCELREAFSKPLSFNTSVNTESNANCRVVNNLFERLGMIDVIDATKYSKPLDRLLFFRHSIAHGSGSLKVEQKDIDGFSLLVQDLMITIITRVIDAIENEIWLKK